MVQRLRPAMRMPQGHTCNVCRSSLALTLGLISALLHCSLACQVVFDRDTPGYTPQSLGLPQSNLTRLFRKVLRCDGKPSFMVMPYLWEPQTVELQCGTLLSYSVYTAKSEEDLLSAYGTRATAWCGLPNLIRNAPCTLSLSPFGQTYVGISGMASCKHHLAQSFNYPMLALYAGGLALFFSADPLSRSLAFRITSGGLLFALGAVIVLAYIFMRSLPGRRTVTMTAVALGGSSLALLKWITGHWTPSLLTLLHSKWFLMYLSISSLLGSAVTYYYGGTDNIKLNNLVRVGLWLLALIAIYFGSWTHDAVALASVVGVVVLRLLLAMGVVRGLLRLIGILRRRTASPQPHEGMPGTPSFNRWLPPEPPEQKTPRMATAVGSSLVLERRQRQQLLAASVPAGGVSPGEALSPLLKSGRVIHPLTGRAIKVGSVEYEDLVEEGYTLDSTSGSMRKPLTRSPCSKSREAARARRQMTDSIAGRPFPRK